jgi:hypothetical protein
MNGKRNYLIIKIIGAIFRYFLAAMIFAFLFNLLVILERNYGTFIAILPVLLFVIIAVILNIYKKE